jgi:hypothetical protein
LSRARSGRLKQPWVNWQRTNALARCGKDRVATRWRDR